MANVDGVLTEADVRAAQAILDAWTDALSGSGTPSPDRVDLFLLRGFIAGQFADVRTAGYLEGLQEGRRATAHLVRDALEGEGL